MIISQANSTEDNCPHCRQRPSGQYFYSGGDNLQLFYALPEAQRSPSAFHGVYSIGHCDKCGGDYFGATLTMLDRDRDDAILDVLWLNTDTTITGLYLAEHKGSLWTIEAHQTPYGLMLKHDFGAYRFRPDLIDSTRRFIIGMWDELRKLFSHPEFAP